jgi:hypothetical protein
VGAFGRTSSTTPSRSTPSSSGIQMRWSLPEVVLTTSNRRNARPASVVSIGRSCRSGTPAPGTGSSAICS